MREGSRLMAWGFFVFCPVVFFLLFCDIVLFIFLQYGSIITTKRKEEKRGF